MITGFSPAVLPPGMSPMPFGRFTGCGYGQLGASCPPPSGSPAARASNPPPAAKWIRYKDPGTQEIYARMYNVLREPAVLGVKVVPEEQADAMARQLVDTILSVPQSQELRFRAACAIKDIVLKPLVIGGTVLGLAGIGYAVYRSRKRAAGR
jgi:hypothetical protein